MEVTIRIEKVDELIAALNNAAGLSCQPVQVAQTVTAPTVQQASPQTMPAQVVAPQTQPYSAQIAQANQLPVGAMTGQAAPQAAPVAVPTTERTYTLDELASAAMQLMDKGLQPQLQELLAGYQVEALPLLSREQYGHFATALRGLGAQI